MNRLDEVDEVPIDLNDPAAIDTVLVQLGCTREALDAAIEAVGKRLTDIERYLAAHSIEGDDADLTMGRYEPAGFGRTSVT